MACNSSRHARGGRAATAGRRGGQRGEDTIDAVWRGRRRATIVRVILAAAALVLLAAPLRAQTQDARVDELDKRLTEARGQAEALQRTIEALAGELRAIRESAPAASASASAAPAPATEPTVRRHSTRRSCAPTSGRTNAAKRSRPLPSCSSRSRFQALPIDDATVADAPTNFDLTRMETRWSGRVSPKVGLGFELQYHPAPDGARSRSSTTRSWSTTRRIG